MEKVANETAYFKLDRHVWFHLSCHWTSFCYIFFLKSRKPMKKTKTNNECILLTCFVCIHSLIYSLCHGAPLFAKVIKTYQ